jgi:hypothetical protein
MGVETRASRKLEACGRAARRALVLVVAGFLFACSADKPTADDDLAKDCAAMGGIWLAEHLECEVDDRAWCTARNGAFDDCASPCRHSPGAICATVCQPLCSFAQ